MTNEVSLLTGVSVKGFDHRSLSSVDRGLALRADGHRFDSWGQAKTQGIRKTKKWKVSSSPANGWISCGSDDQVEITAQSSVAENTALNQYCYAKCIDIAFFYA